ncbi:PfkB family carbohydrate kinase [Oceanobacillus sp. CFH 90083]|uniref:PfkB family carbohydrate kinase n=1 Tax=Oceanobacillus sp. CFH 90083 TaxID=2592336 RepID=UPI00128D9178|nr:PfkB family carbohydrate kinase [Oceanobacillus sp. CFH 90083]
MDKVVECKMTKLLSIGDSVVDYYKYKNTIFPGGNALNVAVVSAHNGAKNNGYMGIIANDYYGAFLRKTLEEECIDISKVRYAIGESPVACVKIDKEGDRIFEGSNIKSRITSGLALRFAPEDIQYINQYDIIHTSIDSHIESQLHLIGHKQISFDFSTKEKWNDDILKQVCPHLTFAFFSGSGMEEKDIYTLISKVAELGVPTIIVTRGEKSTIAYQENKFYFQHPQLIKVVDTMGAGDSFIAGFLTFYTDSKSMEFALRKGAASASRTCQLEGSFGKGELIYEEED